MSASEKEIVPAVSQLLRSRHTDWDKPPEQGVFSRSRIINRALAIYAAVYDVTGSSDYLDVGQAVEDTRVFVDDAFDIYQGKKESEEYPWVFAVPGRIDDGQNGEYASEVTPFLPILSSLYGVDDMTRHHTTASLAPSVIETYNGRGTERGAVVWTPFYVDSTARLDGRAWRGFVHDNIAGIRRSVNETARFAATRLGAQVMGLGASIPSFTQMGKSITQEGLVTTTGHAGTDYLLDETVNAVLEKWDFHEETIGLLGVGSIGSSWAELFMNQRTGQRLSVYDRDDTRTTRLMGRVDRYVIDVQTSELDVLRSSM